MDGIYSWLISWVTGWISGATISIQVPEEMRWEDGRSTRSEERVTANSKPEKHQQLLVPFRDSASDNSSVSLHRVREAFGIFCCCWREVDIGTLARSSTPQPQKCHLRAVRLRLVNVAAERTVHGEVSLPRRPCSSLFAQCQIDAQSSNSSRWSYIQKCSLEMTYGRMESTQSKPCWISKRVIRQKSHNVDKPPIALRTM